jgi:hypothetical protein
MRKEATKCSGECRGRGQPGAKKEVNQMQRRGQPDAEERATRGRGRGQQDAEEANQMQRRRTTCRATGHPGVAREETFVDKYKGKIVNKLLNKHI